MPLLRIALLLLLLACGLTGGSPPAAAQDAGQALMEQRLANLNYQTGTVLLPRAKARIDVPVGWRFVTTEDLAALFDLGSGSIREWDVLGWLLPGRVRIEDDNAWMIELGMFSSGYVAEDTENLDPYRLVWRMRDVYRWANLRDTEYKDASFELVNFARAPVIDRARHVALWSERLRYPTEGGKELIDVFGFALSRRGGVAMEATDMPPDWQDEIEAGVDSLIRSVRFDVGERYEDFGSADDVADYELSHLITAEHWIGPQTWAAWLKQPVKINVPLGGKRSWKFRMQIPNWVFWGTVSLVGLLLVLRWIRGSSRRQQVPKFKPRGTRR